MEERDVIVIGGGPAGYASAIRASQLGGKVTLIEGDSVGGTCLNRGCIPTRALMRGVELIDLAKDAKNFGVNYQEPEIDFTKMMARKDIVVKTLVSGVKAVLNANGVEVIDGTGKLLSSTSVEVQLKDGTKKEIKGRNILLAAGSRCKKNIVPGSDGRNVLDTNEALEIKEIPKSMVIIGGGYIGIAFASIFSRLGVVITVVESATRFLTEFDNEILSIFDKELKKAKIQFLTGTCVTKITDAESGEKEVIVVSNDTETKLTAEYVLITEREVNIEGLALDKQEIELNSFGGIAVKSGHMDTGKKGIFAVGDVTMQHMWTHVAYLEGVIAAENAMGKNTAVDYKAIPYWTHSMPEMSGVGITEEEAKKQGYQLQIGRFSFAANGMATILGHRVGMVKIISEKKYGQILGIHIIGPQAVNLLPEAVMAMNMELTPEEIGQTMHAHPTLSEAFWEASLDVAGEAIHSVSQRKK